AEMSLGEVRRVGTDRFTGFLALQDDGTYRGLIRGETSSSFYARGFDEECSTNLTGSQDLLVIAENVPEGHAGDPGHPIVVRFYPMGQPEIAEIGCDYTLDASPDDPERGIRWGFYAPFNDLRVVDPVRGFLTAMPEGGEWTYVYREFAPGLGGGTWTVTVEVVEPEG
ncbi:MAG TPA: hypothetical protein VMM81_02845, partial [Acidimicrobiia bacterium]|nr:hypothetical protein [Acidimicrobiia bacterium]